MMKGIEQLRSFLSLIDATSIGLTLVATIHAARFVSAISGIEIATIMGWMALVSFLSLLGWAGQQIWSDTERLIRDQ